MQEGYLQVHAFRSKAEIPLKDVSILVLDETKKAIAMRITDRNGKIDPIPIPAPDITDGQKPNPGSLPFTVVSLVARLENYEQIFAEYIQIFPQVVTKQNLEMTPLSEFPDSWEKGETLIGYPQSL